MGLHKRRLVEQILVTPVRVYAGQVIAHNSPGLPHDLGGEDTVSEEHAIHAVDTVVRSLATAAKTLRLYPPTSPIPRQTAEAAVEALSSYFISESVLTLKIDREGFSFRGAKVHAPGSGELADLLTLHGVAETSILPGAGVDELIAFVGAILKDPAEVRAAGGMGAVLAIAGVEGAHEDSFIARERHVVALRDAAAHLREAAAHLAGGLPPLELFAEELREAQNALSSITGEFTADDLLGVIFSRFCIGK